MKKTLAFMFAVSVFAGIGYMLWAYTGAGKAMLSRWLLKQWNIQAQRKKKTIDLQKLARELCKLTYEDHELLSYYTFLDPMGKQQLDTKMESRITKLLRKMSDAGIFKRADLSVLENIVLPG